MVFEWKRIHFTRESQAICRTRSIAKLLSYNKSLSMCLPPPLIFRWGGDPMQIGRAHAHDMHTLIEMEVSNFLWFCPICIVSFINLFIIWGYVAPQHARNEVRIEWLGQKCLLVVCALNDSLGIVHHLKSIHGVFLSRVFHPKCKHSFKKNIFIKGGWLTHFKDWNGSDIFFEENTRCSTKGHANCNKAWDMKTNETL